MRSGPAIRGPLFLEVVPRSFAIKVQNRAFAQSDQVRAGRGDSLGRDAADASIAQEPLLYHNLSASQSRCAPMSSEPIADSSSASI